MDRTEEARAYLASMRGTWPKVVDSTGLGYQWISKFVQGAIRSPSARLVDTVLAHKAEQSRNRKRGNGSPLSTGRTPTNAA